MRGGAHISSEGTSLALHLGLFIFSLVQNVESHNNSTKSEKHGGEKNKIDIKKCANLAYLQGQKTLFSQDFCGSLYEHLCHLVSFGGHVLN